MKLTSYQKELLVYCLETKKNEAYSVIRHFPRCNTSQMHNEITALVYLLSQALAIETTDEEGRD